MTRVKKGLLLGFLAEILLVTLVFLLYFYGVVLLNNPSREVYPVRGVDVSAHQGVIDWEVLSEQGIEFAFIKATEGATFADEHFAYNYAEAARCGLRVGAYHFFRYDRTGGEQAENFISRVEKTENMLPPVIDVEFYGETEKNPPAQAQVRSELDRMVQLLREFYGMDPILYATERSYRLYIAGAYENCDIWIRNVVSNPRLNDGRTWTFWQFTNRRRLPGYEGRTPYIDENVFCGSREQFLQYARE